MPTYKVVLWDEDRQEVDVEAKNHREAAKVSGLAKPGTEITVDGPQKAKIRYQVDSTGRLRELSTYNY